MNRFFLRSLLLFALPLSSLSSAAEPAAKTPAPPESDRTKLIADFRSPIPNAFNHGTWSGKVGVTASGALVQGGRGADGKGELGATLAQPLDLSTAEFVELALGVGLSNEVPFVTIAFDDENDVQYTSRIQISQIMPQQPVWFRVRLSDFKLNDWQKKGPATINWKRITKWHLQGDWQTEAPFHAVFIALRTR